MSTKRIAAAACGVDAALAELVEAMRAKNEAAAKVIAANQQYIAGFVGLVLNGDMLEWAVRLPSKEPGS
jgi:hypothetical protein